MLFAITLLPTFLALLVIATALVLSMINSRLSNDNIFVWPTSLLALTLILAMA
jgi:hypothetical protein